MTIKICNGCGESFDQDLMKRVGRTCRPCINQKRKDFYNEKEKNDPEKVMKNRKRVKEWVDSQPKDGLAIRRKNHYESNKESILERQKLYVAENKDAVKERQKKWREENKAHLRAYREAKTDERKVMMKEWRESNKDHVKDYWNNYYEENKDQLKINNLKWTALNIDKVLQWRKEYYKKNKITILKKNGEWCKANKDKRVYYQAQREAKKLNAMPNWLTKHEKEQMKMIYKDCQLISQETGVLHHVDHIHPLQGEFSCGLHVPWNLQILTASENTSKGNRIID